MTLLPTHSGIRQTAALIAPHIRRTPVIDIAAADLGLHGAPVTLKLEFLQHSGSFKARGAFATMLSRPVPASGVVAASGGNHGAAVAYAAHRLGHPATIFVPDVASEAKRARIRSFGATLVVGGPLYADALEASERHLQTSGALAIHAYDAMETLLGQATTALEWAEQSPALDTLLVAVGGGGLIGGVAAWHAGRIRVIGVEPEACPTLAHALAAGHPVDAPGGGLAADSLAPRQVGHLPFAVAQRFVERVVLVPDSAIAAAQRLLWDQLRIVTEPGGAAALAALTAGAYIPAAGERVGVLLCGANSGAVTLA